MKQHFKYFSFVLIVLYFMSSCTKTEFEENSPKGNDFIKTELLNNKIIHNYKYNNVWKITESESLYFYIRYIYDDGNRLIKKETAMDQSILSCSMPVQRTELMTAKNSTITSYSIFKYDIDGKLFEIENYSIVEGESTLRTKNSLEYDDGNIVRYNNHLANGDIKSFNVFEYDDNGNVIKEKRFSNNDYHISQPWQISETTYNYDNKRNPLKIFEGEGSPGLFTNTNNIIQSNETIFYETISDESTMTNRFVSMVTTYDYNENDFPIRVIQSSQFDYTYFENVP